MSFSAPTNVTVSVPSFALSPDGHKLVFSAESSGTAATLWLRSIDDVATRQLAGTDGAHYPFWSPDSRWIGFVADGKLKKIPAAGGAVQIITDVSTDFRGGSWGDGDTIVFGSGRQPIVSVSSSGGKSQPVTGIDTSRQETTHRFPALLPHRHVLYLILGKNPDRNGITLDRWMGGRRNFFFT